MHVNEIVTMLIMASGTLYILATIMLIVKQKKMGLVVVSIGWLFGLALFIVNWITVSYPPFANMYQVLSVLSLCFMPIYFIINKRDPMKWLLPYFSLASAFPLIGVMFMERQVVWELVPALQSSYFVPHVLSYMISYALCGVAFILTVTSWVCYRFKKKDERQRFNQAIYHILQFGFPFMTIGLLLGAIWAEEAWGIYWSWDTKETWSLITWTLYLVYFHSLRQKGFRKWANVFQILAFVALLVTFLLVNFLPQLASALHGYA